MCSPISNKIFFEYVILLEEKSVCLAHFTFTGFA
jgi:hypothetical protein